MKKRLFSIVAAIALIGVMAFALMACVATDPADAKANLESAGYTVMSIKEGDVGFAVAKAAYSAVTDGEGLTAIVSGVAATTNPDDDIYSRDNVVLLYFAESSQASACYDKYLEDTEKELAESRKEISDERASAKTALDNNELTQSEYDLIVTSLDKVEAALDNIEVGRQGKIVYFGTKAGVKAA